MACPHPHQDSAHVLLNVRVRGGRGCQWHYGNYCNDASVRKRGNAKWSEWPRWTWSSLKTIQV